MSNGPIETAFIEIRPKVSPSFAADIKREILPILKKLGLEAEAAFGKIESSSRGASLGVRTVTRSLNSASKASEDFGNNAVRDAAKAAAAYQRAAAQVGITSRSIDNGTASNVRNARFLGSAFDAMGRTATLAGAAAAAAIGGITAFGLKASGQLEQTKIAFTGLLGSAEEAEAFTVRLQKFAAVTPFEFQELAKGTQRLLALGQTGDEALSTLTTIGDAASAVGADQTSINRVIVALAQITAKGKLSAEELNQVGEALPNFNRGAVVEKLAERFDVTTEKIREMQQKGLIPAKEGTEALLEALKEVPGALGAMDRQAQTLIGRFSTFKDTIKADFSNALLPALDPIGKELLSLTDTISAQLQTVGPALTDSLLTVAPLMDGLVEAFGPLLTEALNSVTPLIAALAPALEPLGTALSQIIEALGPALLPLVDAFVQLAVAIAPVVAIMGVEFASIIVDLTPALLAVVGALSSLFAFLERNAAVAKILTGAVLLLVAALKTYSILAAISAAWVTFTTTLVGSTLVTHGVTAALGALRVALLANPIGLVVGAVALLVGGFILLYKHSENFRKAVSALLRLLIEGFQYAVGFVLSQLGLIINAAATAFGWIPGIGGKLKSAASQFDTFRDNVNRSLDGIQKNLEIKVTVASAADFRRAESGQGLAAASAADFRRAESSAATQAAKAINPTTISTGPAEFLPQSGGGAKAAKAAESAAKKAAAAVKKALIKLADAALAATKKVADGIKTKLKAAQDTLKKLRDQFLEIRNAIVNAFSVDLFESRSAKQFLRRATKNIQTNTTVLQAQTILQSRLGGQAGSSEFLRQLFESGNTRLIKNLAAQSSATLADVLAKFNQDNALATKIGTAVANAFVVGGKPLVVGIKNVQDEIVRLQKLLVAALAKVEAATKARDRLKTAAGGIFNAATDIQVGEAGREVVVPLTRPSRALELMLKSGALGLPTVAAHLGSLENTAQSQSLARLHALGLPSGPTYRPAPQKAAQHGPPALKVVKERVVNQTFNIHEAGDARLTAASVAARTASHMDR